MTTLHPIAARHDRERELLTGLGVRRVRAKMLAIQARVINAYRHGRNPVHDLRLITGELAPVVQDAMVAAHLRGSLTAVQLAPNEPTVKLDIYDNAVDFLQRRMNLSDGDLRALADLYGKPAASMTGDLTSDLERRVAQAVTQAAAEGTHTAGGIQRIREAFDAAGVSPRSDFQLETIFRTNVQVAYSAGQWNANQDPFIDESLWGYEYVTVGDDRVRPNHAALDGVRLPKNDPRWDTLTPPCGFNCRCSLISVYHGDAEARTVEPPTGTVTVGNREVPVGPDPGWDFHPGKLYRDTLAVGV